MTDKTRKFADKTRDKILKAAAHLFAKQGFSGTSMQSIANKASLNQTLLYHHFKNKKTLWKTTKAHIFNQITTADYDIPDARLGLTTVLTHIINQRFNLYNNNTIARMMLWQQLESNQEGIMGSNTPASPSQWLPILTELQANNQLRSDIDPHYIINWIASSVMGIVFANQSLFINDPRKKKNYIIMLIQEFCTILKPK